MITGLKLKTNIMMQQLIGSVSADHSVIMTRVKVKTKRK
jgi:hypothetical protein